MSTIISKISTKTVGANLTNAKTDVLDLYLVYGVASGVEKVETAYGDSTKLTGQFEAVNKETGEVFISGQLYLPASVASLIAGKLKSASKEIDSDTVSVQFAFSIGTKPAKTNVGYEYTVKEEIEPDGLDSLSELRNASRKALN
jgi:hypothetical protein